MKYHYIIKKWFGPTLSDPNEICKTKTLTTS